MTTRIAIAGLGAIGRAVARRLTDGLPGLSLAAIATGNAGKARDWLKEQNIDCPVVELEEFPEHADLAVECAPASLLERICKPMLEAGKQVMVLSCGALLPRPDLIDLAKAHGGRILVPTGALLGLDAVAAAAEGKIYSVKMTTRKPPGGLVGAPLSREEQHLGRRIEHRQARVQRHRARGRRGISGQRQCRRRAVARRHRAGQDHDRHLGRSRGDAELSFHRGRFRHARASRCRSRTFRRKIRRPARTSRCR